MADASDPLSELRDIHLPPLTSSEQIGDLLVAFGLGLALALALGALLRWLAKDRTAGPRIAAHKQTPLVALAREAAQSGADLPPDMRDALFRPGADAQLDTLEAALKRTPDKAA